MDGVTPAGQTVGDGPAGIRHVLIALAAATLVLTTVFAVVLGAVPQGFIPTAPGWLVETIPHVNALCSLGAISAISVGWHAIRRGRVRRHRWAMGLAVLFFAVFLGLYLYRLTLRGGPTPFQGPTVVYRYLYLPILGVHVALAITCVPLLSYVLTLGLSIPSARIGETPHPRVGRIATALWLGTFSLGLAVYALLFGPWFGPG